MPKSRSGKHSRQTDGMDKEHEEKVVQDASTGTGQLIERRYWVDVQNPTCTPEELIQYIKANIDAKLAAAPAAGATPAPASN